MAQAYVPIQTVTVGSGGSSTIDFTNIPQNYTDLLVKLSVRSSASGGAADIALNMSINGVTTNRTWRRLEGYNGSTVASGNGTSSLVGVLGGSTTTANTFAQNEVYIPNYAGSNNKSFSTETASEDNSASSNELEFLAGLWSNTSAITQLTFSAGTGNFVQHSTATLYGIGGARASGGTITADARYTYHTFTSTGTFTALEKIKGAEVLLVAGGGGGAGQPDSGNGNGGGGAGGVLYTAGQLLFAGSSYTVVVGSGGSGGSAGSNNGSKGSNSTFASLSAEGGGYGAKTPDSGGSGGSGGGGSAYSNAGGTATSGQGNNGGAGGTSSTYRGGGGGGAGSVGVDGNTSGNGGTGTTTYSSWNYATSTGVSFDGAYYIAGGGGGGQYFNTAYGSTGLGGQGGGGNGGYWNGSSIVASTAGTSNTGGGGGASGSKDGQGTKAGSSGGSGLVIIRYPN